MVWKYFFGVAAAGERRLAGERNMRMFRRPGRLEASLLQRRAELPWCHGIVGEEHGYAELQQAGFSCGLDRDMLPDSPPILQSRRKVDNA